MTIELYPAGEPGYAISPGEEIREFLDDLGMVQRELALQLGLSTEHLDRLMEGSVPLTAGVAGRLERITGMSAKMWNRLEVDYRATQQRLQSMDDPDAHGRGTAALRDPS